MLGSGRLLRAVAAACHLGVILQLLTQQVCCMLRILAIGMDKFTPMQAVLHVP